MRDLITRLGRRLQRASTDERGAVVILVALLLGFGVLLGMAALVVDVGRLYQERAELQDGADAAAIGVAKSCALGACNPAVATSYADANASRLTGGTAGVPMICGSGGMGLCPGSTGTMIDCPQPPPAGTNYVDVHTATQTASGSTLLPPVFAATLLGNSGYQGSTVHACAQAEWGPPSAATTTAVAISACEWDQATQLGTSFAPAPPYPPNQPPAASFDQVLRLSPGTGGGCATEPAGADGPGSFGWAADLLGNCSLPVSGSSFPGATPISVPGSCQRALDNSQDNQVPILVPVYVSLDNSSGSPSYALKGFADFVVTGYNMPGFSDSDWLDPANDCQGSDYCLNGYFVPGVIPFTGSFGSNDLGVSVIQLTG
jgi:Putative Flp pilus-assembly TadE/G-like